MARLLVRRDGAVGTVVLSNPEKYNAMTTGMWRELPQRIAELDADPMVHAIVLTGEGDQAFAAGADISQFGEERSGSTAPDYAELVNAAYMAPAQARKPVIAKIRGICMGGGLGLAAGCDLRICADDARFRMSAARLGLGYMPEGVHRFIALIGVQNTYDIFYSARVFGADEALRMGFVSRVVASEALDAVVAEYAANIAENAPLTLHAVKLAVNDWLAGGNTAAAHAAADACNASADYQEGVRAFAEKRKPVFSGR